MRFQPFSSSLFPRLLPHLAFFRLFYALFSLFCFSPRPPFFVSRRSSTSCPIYLCDSAPSNRALTSVAARAFFVPSVPLLYVLRSVFYVLCFVPYALCSMSCSARLVLCLPSWRCFCSLSCSVYAFLLPVSLFCPFSVSFCSFFCFFFAFFRSFVSVFTYFFAFRCRSSRFFVPCRLFFRPCLYKIPYATVFLRFSLSPPFSRFGFSFWLYFSFPKLLIVSHETIVANRSKKVTRRQKVL